MEINKVYLQKVTPLRSEKYKEFVREHRCAACGTTYPCQAHHECLGDNKIGGKCGDERAVPLCWRCHTARHAMSAEEFWALCNADPQRLMIELLGEYLQKYGRD